MRRESQDCLSDAAVRDLPKLIAAFLVAMMAVLAGALVYSQSQQEHSGMSAPALLNALKGQTPSSDHAAPASDQSSPHNIALAGKYKNMSTDAASTSELDADSRIELRRPTSPVQAQPKRPSAGTSANPVQQRTPLIPFFVDDKASHRDTAAHVSESVGSGESEHPASDGHANEHITPEYHVSVTEAAPQLPPPPVIQTQSAPNMPQPLPNTVSAGIPPHPEQVRVNIPVGTSLRVRLSDTLSSDRNRTGDTFRAVLDSALVAHGVVIAPTSSVVLGLIANAHKAPLLGGKADLSLTLTSITMPGGHVVTVATNNIEREGARSGMVNTAKMATGAAFGAVVGAVTGAAEGAGISSGLNKEDPLNGFLATKRTVVVPAGTEIMFSVARSLTVAE